jgi:hypothetical protein
MARELKQNNDSRPDHAPALHAGDREEFKPRSISVPCQVNVSVERFI